MLCDTCVNAGTASYKYPCNCCDMIEGSSRCKYKKVRTHADRIRAMSDEELYLWAKKQIGCGFDFFPCGVVCEGKCESYSDEDCKEKILNWLKQPAEE